MRYNVNNVNVIDFQTSGWKKVFKIFHGVKIFPNLVLRHFEFDGFLILVFKPSF